MAKKLHNMILLTLIITLVAVAVLEKSRRGFLTGSDGDELLDDVPG